MEVNMTHAEHLAEFAARAAYEKLSDAAVKELNKESWTL